MAGTSATAFEPEAPMNRVMPAAVQYRVKGSIAVSGKTIVPFYAYVGSGLSSSDGGSSADSAQSAVNTWLDTLNLPRK